MDRRIREQLERMRDYQPNDAELVRLGRDLHQQFHHNVEHILREEEHCEGAGQRCLESVWSGLYGESAVDAVQTATTRLSDLVPALSELEHVS